MSQRSIVTELRTWLGQQIIGQESLIDRQGFGDKKVGSIDSVTSFDI